MSNKPEQTESRGLMKTVLQWAVNNSPAMNTIMIAGLLIGAFCMFTLRRETFPRFELEIILVSVPYPGASPDEVETGVCQKVEEAVRSIDGIKKITSVAKEGSASVVIELEADVPDVQKVLGEVEAAVDRIPSLPEFAENPEIQQLTIRNPAIKVAIMMDESDDPQWPVKLRERVERVREDMLLLPSVTTVEIVGSRDYEIAVEISERTLREHKLTLQQVAQILKNQNLELPGGKLKTRSEEILLRSKNKRVTGEEIAKIPLITKSNGVVLTVGDLGHVRDEFADTTAISRVNGKPGLVLQAEAAAREDILAMTEEIKGYVDTTELPYGYSFEVFEDTSVDVADRLDLLQRNGLQGLILVFLVLALFLELRLAFWVALGIPISVLGAAVVLMFSGATLNMLSMFAFLIALGIVVDDAIVIGENIYAHREMGKGAVRAAIDGALEVLPSVAASVTTTVIAFMPMFYVTGVMGKFFAVMPLAIIAMLIISLVESMFILPCHLAHSEAGEGESFTQQVRRVRRDLPFVFRWSVGPILVLCAFVADNVYIPLSWIGSWFAACNRGVGKGLEFVIQRLYRPALGFCLNNPAIVVCTSLALLIFTFGFVRSGSVPWIFFPKMDTRVIQTQIIFPNGTPADVTDKATQQLEQVILEIGQEYEDAGQKVVRVTHRQVGQVTSNAPGGPPMQMDGSHIGLVKVELVDNTQRDVTSQQIVDQWRKRAGQISGAESLTFGTQRMGPGGTPIEFKLLANAEHMDDLELAVEEVKEKLKSYPGVFDVVDDSRPGKWEYQLTLKEEGKALNVPLAVLGNKVRGAYYGEEAMRLQRGRHEIKLMVRYPPKERESLATFNDIRVDDGNGEKRPLSELATISRERGYSEINRINQMRSITISADVDEEEANASQVVRDLQANFIPELMDKYPSIRVRWEGQQEQTAESVKSLMIGFVVALLAMFVLLTLEFTSYFQPLIIMAVIPFGAIGAIWGHYVMDLPLTLFSVMGLVALTGVVVNDSIVLVDFINKQLKEGVPLEEALREAGLRRFRPVLLTSLTTIAGLFPLLMETSLQAQLLVPMATSLCFGLMVATFLVLFLVPTFYLIYARTIQLVSSESHQEGAESDDEMTVLDSEEDKRVAPAPASTGS